MKCSYAIPLLLYDKNLCDFYNRKKFRDSLKNLKLRNAYEGLPPQKFSAQILGRRAFHTMKTEGGHQEKSRKKE
jgi:hypothetical protein